MHGVGGEGGALVFAYTVNSLGSRVTYLNGMAPLPTLHMYVCRVDNSHYFFVHMYTCMYVYTYICKDSGKLTTASVIELKGPTQWFMVQKMTR